MSEDDRTLFCGNISEKVTEEILYELFLQAGPIESVRIPRDADRRQRSYAFITFTHACSVEYAINIFEGTTLFQRQLTLKNRNGPNPAGSPQVNFNYPVGGNNANHQSKRYSDDSPPRASQRPPVDGNAFISPDMRLEAYPALAGFMNSQNIFPMDLMIQLGQQMLGAELPPFGSEPEQQQSSLQTKAQRSERSHYQDRHSKKPYSRDDRYDRGYNNERSDSHSSRHRHDHGSKRNSNDQDHYRNSRRRR